MEETLYGFFRNIHLPNSIDNIGASKGRVEHQIIDIKYDRSACASRAGDRSFYQGLPGNTRKGKNISGIERGEFSFIRARCHTPAFVTRARKRRHVSFDTEYMARCIILTVSGFTGEK